MELLFRALDRPEHVANLLSLELTGAWVNEAREVPWAVIKALKGRVDRYPPRNEGGCIDTGIIMDTNPPEDDSWWYRLFEERGDDEGDTRNVEIFKQPSGRSPEAENLPNLSPSYYQNLMAGADADFIRVYVDGLYGYVRDGKPVYPEYNDALHCSEVEPVKGVTIARGWYFGLSPACVFTQVLPDGRWIVFEESASLHSLWGITVLDKLAQLIAGLRSIFVAVYRGGMLHRDFEQLPFAIGRDRNAALAIAREFTAIEVFASHPSLPLRTKNLIFCTFPGCLGIGTLSSARRTVSFRLPCRRYTERLTGSDRP